MNQCKNCSVPIPDAQVYCCLKCWQEDRNPQSPFVDELHSNSSISDWIWSQVIAWCSILGMFFSLFILLVTIASFIDNFQYYLIASTIGLSIFVFLVLLKQNTI